MSKSDNLQELLQGIDKREIDGGWWPTSQGAEFGELVKKAIESELAARDAEIVKIREAGDELAMVVRRHLDLCGYQDDMVTDYLSEWNDVYVGRATKAAVNRVRADAVLEAEQALDRAELPTDNAQQDEGVAHACRWLEDYANKLRNPDQANREE